MRALILTPDRNTPGFKDWSGAFRPRARDFRDRWLGSELVQIPVGPDHGYVTRRTAAYRAIERAGQFDCLAVFGHGWLDGTQVGFNRATVPDLARRLLDAGCHTVVLYCCLNGTGPGVGGDGGFADRLRDGSGLKVLAHATAGHCTANPYVRVFRGPDPAVGGAWVVAPGSAGWADWKAGLRRLAWMELPATP